MQSIPFCELTPRTGQIQYYCITPQHFSQPGTVYFRFFWQFAFLMQKQHPQTAYCKYARLPFLVYPAPVPLRPHRCCYVLPVSQNQLTYHLDMLAVREHIHRGAALHAVTLFRQQGEVTGQRFRAQSMRWNKSTTL